MSIGDMVEMTQFWPLEKVAALDDRLRSERLPTLSEIRVRFSKSIGRALRRGRIKDDTEYYAVRNAAEMQEDRQADLWALLAAYEARAVLSDPTAPFRGFAALRETLLPPARAPKS